MSSPSSATATSTNLLLIVFFLLLPIVESADAKRVTTKHGGGDLPDSVIEYKWPSYPYLARAKLFDGAGRFRLHIDRATGNVTSVTVLKSTTHKLLDDAAVTAFMKWRFKPHAAETADVPVTFTLQGKRLSEARRLAVYAVEPDQPVTFHSGNGVFRFIIDYETGQTTDVKIIRSTGRVSFDQAVIKAYRQWRFVPHKVHTIDTTVGFGP
jgi:TonB family protein